MILLLQADYTPLNVISLKRGYKLLYKGKAVIVERDELHPINGDGRTYDRPTVIKLINYVKTPFKTLPLTRQNIFKRDGHKCVYCGSPKDLTLDHIVPSSKGGKSSWSNLVTCCSPCNRRKDNMSLEDSGYKLDFKPSAPSYISLLVRTYKGREDWKKYIFH